MKWLIGTTFVLVAGFMFVLFFTTTSQTIEGDRFTYCDALWHEHFFHDQEIPLECADKLNTKYIKNYYER